MNEMIQTIENQVKEVEERSSVVGKGTQRFDEITPCL
jgi:hypothetical protein